MAIPKVIQRQDHLLSASGAIVIVMLLQDSLIDISEKEKDPTSIPLPEAERGFKTPLPW
jgi:hypothetical protein